MNNMSWMCDVRWRWTKRHLSAKRANSCSVQRAMYHAQTCTKEDHAEVLLLCV